MPYRLNPENRKEVQVKRGGKWVRYKLKESVKAALALLAALVLNVMKKKGHKR